MLHASSRNLRSILLLLVLSSLLSAQTQTPPQGQQPPPEAPPAAGGPQGEISPMAIPKKKETPPEPPKPKLKNPEGLPNYSLTVDVPLVNVDVMVMTGNGEFIPGLKKENFKVLEDGVPQQISNFSQSEAPITAVLLVEFANTHYAFINDMLTHAYGFAEGLKPNDWVALVSYDMHTDIVVDFTQNKNAIIGGLNSLRMPGFSETNLFDALVETLDRVERVEGRKYIVLVASGVDTFSKLTLDKTLKKIKNSRDITIFTVSTGQALRMQYEPYTGPITNLTFLQADNQMNTFAKMTGGKAYFPRFQGQMPEIMRDIANSIRNQYSISYHSSNAKQDGSFRKIKVELVDANGLPLRIAVNGKEQRKVNIIARDGYYARHEVE